MLRFTGIRVVPCIIGLGQWLPGRRKGADGNDPLQSMGQSAIFLPGFFLEILVPQCKIHKRQQRLGAGKEHGAGSKPQLFPIRCPYPQSSRKLFNPFGIITQIKPHGHNMARRPQQSRFGIVPKIVQCGMNR